VPKKVRGRDKHLCGNGGRELEDIKRVRPELSGA